MMGLKLTYLPIRGPILVLFGSNLTIFAKMAFLVKLVKISDICSKSAIFALKSTILGLNGAILSYI